MTCGGGTQSQSYEVTTASQHGGQRCPASPRSRSCNTHGCPVSQTMSKVKGAGRSKKQLVSFVDGRSTVLAVGVLGVAVVRPAEAALRAKPSQ